MEILVAYSTVEGQTRKIATYIAERFESLGHRVVLSDLREPGFALPDSFDAVVRCGPIHLGQYPQPLMRFARDFARALNDRPSALVTVSLGIASEHEDERLEAQAFPTQLAEASGWVPALRHDAAGALKYLEYDFFKRWIMRRIAAHEGGPVDTHRDHELTDWAALDGFVDDFLSCAGSSLGRAGSSDKA